MKRVLHRGRRGETASMSTKCDTGPRWRSSASLPVRTLNRLARGAAKLGAKPARLRADELIDLARRRNGLHDLGNPSCLEPLEVLAASLGREAGLHPVGRWLVRFRLLDLLGDRLRIVDAARRDEGIRGQEIRRPVFVTGLPRTGTTLIARLLALDPGARPLMAGEDFFPVPSPTARTSWSLRRDARSTRDSRATALRRVLRAQRILVPELRRIHEIVADEMDEDWNLMQRSLVTWHFLALAHIPSYERWMWTRGRSTLEDGYRFHRLQL